MRELIYTLLELVGESKKTCDFCSSPHGKDNKSAFRIVTRIKSNNEWLADDVVCEDCKEKFENDELLKCERCGRLQTKHDFSFSAGKYICDCIRYNEDLEEKELPSVPYESQAVVYERQINGLREKERELTEEIDTHLEALEIAEDWHKRQKQELLDKIAQLEEKNKKLEEQNRQLLPEELAKKIESYEKEIAELKQQLVQLTAQQTAQIETPTKDKGIKGFFKFGSK